MRLAIMTAMLALAGCTASAEMQESDRAKAQAELADALDGLTPGEPRDCISASGMMNGPQIIDGRTLLYRESGRRTWRNDLRADCPSLDRSSTIVVEIHGSQLCRNDHFRVLEPGSRVPGGICFLGAFTPYEKK